MKDFTFKKGLVGNGLFVPSSFKSFMVMVVMIIMTTSSAMAQDAKFEVIDGFRYLLFTGTKTASLIASTKEKYSGDIVVPEKVKSSNGVEYNVTSLGDYCFNGCSALKTVCFKGKVSEMYSSETLPSTSVINVPAEYLQDYKDAFGTDYHYIYLCLEP